MGTKLFTFLYNTLRKRANNPNNQSLWLPRVLKSVNNPTGPGPLLPLQGTDWKLGQITGTAGTTFVNAIMGQWWLAIGRERKNDPELANHKPIACPDAPWPRLDMPTLTVYGLDNVALLENPVVTEPTAGYEVVMTLQFGYYHGQNGLPNLSALKIDGKYSLTQCLCSTNKNNDVTAGSVVCDHYASENVHGVGNFTATLMNVFVDATVRFQTMSSGSHRTLQAFVDKIVMRGKTVDTLPDISVDDLTVDTSMKWMANNIWLPQAKRALESQDGRKALVANLSAALNTKDNLDVMAGMLTRQLNQSVDDTLGSPGSNPLPAGSAQAPQNPVDAYLFDRLRAALGNQASDYYLPKVIYSSNHPVLEPYHADQISLGNQEFSGLQLQDLTLTNVTLTGASNIMAPPDQLTYDSGAILATLMLSVLSPPPWVSFGRNGTTVSQQVPSPPLQITGLFSLRVPGSDDVLGGAVSISVGGATVHADVSMSGENADELQINFRTLILQAKLSNIRVKVEVDSAFSDIINQVFNQDSVKGPLFQRLNDAITQNLPEISQTATQNIRTLVAAKLGQ